MSEYIPRIPRISPYPKNIEHKIWPNSFRNNNNFLYLYNRNKLLVVMN